MHMANRVIAVAGASAGSVWQERFRKAAAQPLRHLQEIHVLFRSRGTLHAHFVTVEVVISFQCFDDEIVHRKPDRPAPIGIAAKQAGSGLARRVIHTMFLTIGLQHEGGDRDESATTSLCHAATETRFRPKGSATPVPAVRAMGSQAIDGFGRCDRNRFASCEYGMQVDSSLRT